MKSFQETRFSVLSTPVALCDRRALSQAWYSALRLHRDAARTASKRMPNSVEKHAQRTSRDGKKVVSSLAVPQLLRQAKTATSRTVLTAAIERRAVRTPLARAIERVFLRSAEAPAQAAFAIDGERGRVQILLRKNGSQTQIVALCSHGAREKVTQALAQVRYTLALRGIAIQADVRGFVS